MNLVPLNRGGQRGFSPTAVAMRATVGLLVWGLLFAAQEGVAANSEEVSVLLLAYAERSGDAARAGKVANLFLEMGVASEPSLLQETRRCLVTGNWQGRLAEIEVLLAALGLPRYPIPPGLESGDVFVDRLGAVPAAAALQEPQLARVQALRELFPVSPALVRLETQMLRLFVQKLKPGEIGNAVPEAERLQRAVPGRPEFKTLIVRLTEMAMAEEKKRELEQKGNETVGKYRALLREFEKKHSGTTFYDQRRTVRLTKTQQEELAREKAFLEENLSRGREWLAQAGAIPPVEEQLRELRVELGLAPRQVQKKGIVR